ncbi:MAG: thioredoxin family protein [Maribacter sp.]
MKLLLTCYSFLLTTILCAQGSISGNFSPSKEYTWLIAYALTPGGENYVADAEVKDGFFNLKMPTTAQPGMYRLVYAVPQDEFYIDVIYDKKEQISFNFDRQIGLTITKSTVNNHYNAYFRKIAAVQKKLTEFFTDGNGTDEQYHAIKTELKVLQDTYEQSTSGTIAHRFIASNKVYMPKKRPSLAAFKALIGTHYFDNVDLHDPILQGSDFLTGKIQAYVFAAFPWEDTSRSNADDVTKERVDMVAERIKNTPQEFQEKVFYKLWNLANTAAMHEIADYLYTNHVKSLAISNGHLKTIADIESETKLRLGAVSPEITWKTNGKERSLSQMEEAEQYLLIFWSSTCSHCLHELPILHKELASYEGLTVVAVGLEDEETNWKKVSATMPNFNHALALGKWESEYVKTFDIQQTPTYFILDHKKRFLAKPHSDKEVVKFLKGL